MDQFISKNNLKWIPYNEFENVEYFDGKEFSTICRATYKSIKIVLKCFNYLNNPDENFGEFLNNWKIINNSGKIINIYGFTKNPVTLDYMLIMEYANKGNLRVCLKEITKNWKQILCILYIIIEGLDILHNEDFIHYDFHDGNILCFEYKYTDIIYISDYFKPYPFTKSSLKKNICGVIPFMAPEVLRGNPYTSASNIYSFSMIMWELTSRIPPFNDKAHDFQLALSICKGERPKIIENTPQSYTDLMKKCWNDDPLKRPSASEVLDIIKKWACYTSHLLDFTSEELNEVLEGSPELKFYELKFFEYRQKEKDAKQKLEKAVEENKIQLIDLQQRNSQFEQDNQYLRLELAKQIKEFAEKENTLQTKITYLQNEIYEKQVLTGNLTESLKQNKLASQQIQIQINQLKQEKSNLQEKLAQTEVNIEELKTQQESLIKQKTQLEIELNQFKTNCEQIEQEKVELQNIMGGLIQNQRFAAKLKIKCAKSEKEIAHLVQRLDNEEQIKVQLTRAIQIKEDKINELEQKLINFDSQKELDEFEKKSVNELTNEENTKNIL
ncbi:hypothetical protein RclHR1_10040006 [Rhizophagus clarus]|uniref:Protein kinase domain-containing protein n=1 Tax=Rhizophagus clarus TaxID=94130 RepID=A0A2Z6Q0U1_9GLOM|nr:hypothetical protein RclHR1_10040006 [Rhizophagus clarus]